MESCSVFGARNGESRELGFNIEAQGYVFLGLRMVVSGNWHLRFASLKKLSPIKAGYLEVSLTLVWVWSSR